MAEGLAEFLGRLLLALAHLSAVDHHVVVIGDTVNTDGAKGERLEAYGASASIIRPARSGEPVDRQFGRNNCAGEGSLRMDRSHLPAKVAPAFSQPTRCLSAPVNRLNRRRSSHCT